MKKIIYISLLILAAHTSQAQEANQFKAIGLTAYAKNNKMFIDWKTDSIATDNYFEVQRSTDGKTFKTIGLVMGPDPRQEGGHYSYSEKVKSKTNEKIYYRLCYTDSKGDKK